MTISETPWYRGKQFIETSTSGTPWETEKQNGMTFPCKLFIFVFGFIPWISGMLLIIGRILELCGVL